MTTSDSVNEPFTPHLKRLFLPSSFTSQISTDSFLGSHTLHGISATSSHFILYAWSKALVIFKTNNILYRPQYSTTSNGENNGTEKELQKSSEVQILRMYTLKEKTFSTTPVFVPGTNIIVCVLDNGKSILQLKVPVSTVSMEGSKQQKTEEGFDERTEVRPVLNQNDQVIKTVKPIEEKNDAADIEILSFKKKPILPNFHRIQHSKNKVQIKKMVVSESLEGVVLLVSSIGYLSLYTVATKQNSKFLTTKITVSLSEKAASNNLPSLSEQPSSESKPKKRRSSRNQPQKEEVKLPKVENSRVQNLATMLLQNDDEAENPDSWSVLLLEHISFLDPTETKTKRQRKSSVSSQSEMKANEHQTWPDDIRLRRVQLHSKNGALVLEKQHVLSVAKVLTTHFDGSSEGQLVSPSADIVSSFRCSLCPGNAVTCFLLTSYGDLVDFKADFGKNTLEVLSRSSVFPVEECEKKKKHKRKLHEIMDGLGSTATMESEHAGEDEQMLLSKSPTKKAKQSRKVNGKGKGKTQSGGISNRSSTSSQLSETNQVSRKDADTDESITFRKAKVKHSCFLESPKDSSSPLSLSLNLLAFHLDNSKIMLYSFSEQKVLGTMKMTSKTADGNIQKKEMKKKKKKKKRKDKENGKENESESEGPVVMNMLCTSWKPSGSYCFVFTDQAGIYYFHSPCSKQTLAEKLQAAQNTQLTSCRLPSSEKMRIFGVENLQAMTNDAAQHKKTEETGEESEDETILEGKDRVVQDMLECKVSVHDILQMIAKESGEGKQLLIRNVFEASIDILGMGEEFDVESTEDRRDVGNLFALVNEMIKFGLNFNYRGDVNVHGKELLYLSLYHDQIYSLFLMLTLRQMRFYTENLVDSLKVLCSFKTKSLDSMGSKIQSYFTELVDHGNFEAEERKILGSAFLVSHDPAVSSSQVCLNYLVIKLMDNLDPMEKPEMDGKKTPLLGRETILRKNLLKLQTEQEVTLHVLFSVVTNLFVLYHSTSETIWSKLSERSPKIQRAQGAGSTHEFRALDVFKLPSYASCLAWLNLALDHNYKSLNSILARNKQFVSCVKALKVTCDEARKVDEHLVDLIVPLEKIALTSAIEKKTGKPGRLASEAPGLFCIEKLLM